MKNLITFQICFIAISSTSQQNLVQNASFEIYSACPDDWNQINRASNWESYKGSPDYYNFCGTQDTFSTPQNYIGNQQASSGDSYAGLILYSIDDIGADEMIGTELITPLTIGNKYYVSFKVVLKYNNPFWICCGNNKIGIKFSNQSFNISSPPPIDNYAHVYTDSVIVDTTNWTQVFGSFVADDNYSHLIFGNFFDTSNMQIDTIIPGNGYSYYFVDDICVSTDSLTSLNYYFNAISAESKSEIRLFPNPVEDNFTILHGDKIHIKKITIYDLLGKEIDDLECVGELETKYDFSSFPAGIFIVQMETSDGIYIFKLLKN